MEQRIPVNPGTVEWSGENPGIYLKQRADGPFTALAVFFRVVLSPHGRGHTMLVLEEPDSAKGMPDAGNICLTDNEQLTRYLIDDFVAKFPTFRDRPGLQSMTVLPLTGVESAGDFRHRYSEKATSGDLEVAMTWGPLNAPFAVEVSADQSVTGRHDMYSVFLEALDASIAINGRPVAGKVASRTLYGKVMSTAFLAISETWVAVNP